MLTTKDQNTIGDLRTPVTILSTLGLIPLILAPSMAMMMPEQKQMWLFIQLIYGAAMLSFVGGIQWGLVMRSSSLDGVKNSFYGLHYLLLSTIPLIMAVISLSLSRSSATLFLSLSYLALAIVDSLLHREGINDEWYLQIRWVMTAATLLSFASMLFVNAA